ncbi:MAG: carbon monoxide dehydrogenase [Rhizobium sp. 63-7]|nr:MAG: carbon monoxide dehydrogenase [Rhizobium sp. 63-7]
MPVEIKDEHKIDASVEQVWAALNDPDVLQICIPGCERLEKSTDTDMAATVVLKIGPIKARFEGSVQLCDLNPPFSYTIVGEGKGGVAGFAKGTADVILTEQADGGTLLQYNVKVDIGGKIAQLGSRLIDSTARKLSAQFFSKFVSSLEKETAS